MSLLLIPSPPMKPIRPAGVKDLESSARTIPKAIPTFHAADASWGRRALTRSFPIYRVQNEVTPCKVRESRGPYKERERTYSIILRYASESHIQYVESSRVDLSCRLHKT